MKKSSLILAALVLFASVTFAAPVKKQDAKTKAKTEQKAPAKENKSTTKAQKGTGKAKQGKQAKAAADKK